MTEADQALPRRDDDGDDELGALFAEATAATAVDDRAPDPATRTDTPVPEIDEPAKREDKDADGGPDGADETGDDTSVRRNPFRRTPRRKLRARRVDRIIRRIDPWSVLKVSFLFYLCLWIIFMMAGVILWSAAVGSGTVENVEDFITELFALKTFSFEGEQIFRSSALGGLILVVVGTGFNVLVAVLFNLISDLTGGIRASVVELENVRRTGRTARGSKSKK